MDSICCAFFVFSGEKEGTADGVRIRKISKKRMGRQIRQTITDRGMLENRDYEKMLAIACEYAERIGSMEEALQLLGIKEELPELLEHD